MSPSNLPGNPLWPAELAGSLKKALAHAGPGYVARTHHKDAAGVPRFTNRLILEASPYLIQHAHNPVNWFPWGPEAFAQARMQDRPIFLSVGYSTCHWCHVMEEESFEDEEIAAYLNSHFVCIKVDREERPDIDAIYMAAVQALTGRGGWPMSVWLTPEAQPFYGGTYFPPRDGARGTRVGFLTLLGQLATIFAKDRTQINKATASLVQVVRANLGNSDDTAGAQAPGAEILLAVVAQLKSTFDSIHGGLRRAPKFPSNVPVRVLLRAYLRTDDEAPLQMATLTLEKMAAGGLCDQLGGGFHRYSTDERWLVPHFEKMLYDNALLAVAYAEAHQVTGRADFARVLRETLDYVLREMTAPEGTFYSATDADSEGEEGRFFVWSEAEIREILGQEADPFLAYYAVTSGGNFEGQNILHAPHPNEATHAALAGARKKLYEHRQKRVQPLRDDKVVAAWNGLMISAFAIAGRVLAEPVYLKAAAASAAALLQRLSGEGGRLLRSYRGERLGPSGFLDDHAFVLAGLLDLFAATADPVWFHAGCAVADVTEKLFADDAQGGWFMTAHDSEALIAREKPRYDGAEPSGTSVAIRNCLRLAALTGLDRWRQIAERALQSLAEPMGERPLALTEALLATDWISDRGLECVVVYPDGGAAGPLGEVLRCSFLPNASFLVASESRMAALAQFIPFAAGKSCVAGKPTAYVCETGRCGPPCMTPEALAAALEAVRRPLG